jgi:dTDP-L-rhamnose 4-epimerase
MKVLITGGAGFIGQRLAQKLLNQGAEVRILDNFNEQIHGFSELPEVLKNHVELVKADIRDRTAIKQALLDSEKVVHFAAETGTGQSMYEIERYFSVNVQGTATLLDVLQNDEAGSKINNIVVASSRAIYGEGAYHCHQHGIVYPNQRSYENLSQGQFDPVCPVCQEVVDLVATTEAAPFKPMSVYGLTKQVQEQALLMFAHTRGINGFGLRYQNVYGPGQSLKNPYTGILAVFSNLARQNQTIEIYEDGKESRDFVYIDDIVDATIRSLNFTGKFTGALNVGSGQPTSVLDVAMNIKTYFKSESQIKISGAFRVGDIRHNIADLKLIDDILDFKPKTDFNFGLTQFLDWALFQPEQDKNAYTRSANELKSKGLMGKSTIIS